MNKDQFHRYLLSPNQLNAESLVELNDLITEYPYFQAARMLYVKNLKNVQSIRFSKQLKNAAAYINNRKLLFGLLNDIRISSDGSFYPLKYDLFLDEEPGEGENAFKKGEILSLIDEGQDTVNSENSFELTPKYEKSLYVQELERFIPIADLDLLLIDYPIDDPDTLDFDFEDSLPEISDEPVSLGENQMDNSDFSGVSSRDLVEQFIHSDIDRSRGSDLRPKSSERQDLIDEFIRRNPRMPKPEESAQKNNNVLLNVLKDDDGLMTETLADIYMKQGYYYRAMQAYEKLSLKNPEKSIYFASQIQKIKKLITNQ